MHQYVVRTDSRHRVLVHHTQAEELGRRDSEISFNGHVLFFGVGTLSRMMPGAAKKTK